MYIKWELHPTLTQINSGLLQENPRIITSNFIVNETECCEAAPKCQNLVDVHGYILTNNTPILFNNQNRIPNNYATFCFPNNENIGINIVGFSPGDNTTYVSSYSGVTGQCFYILFTEGRSSGYVKIMFESVENG